MKNLYKIIALIFGIIMIGGGIVCLASPGLTFLTIGWIVGLAMVADAIANIVTWSARRRAGQADGWTLAGAIVSLVFGIVLLTSDILQLSIDLFIAYMAALWILTLGIFRLIKSSKLHQIHKEFDTEVVAKNWWIVMLSGILLVLLGVLSLMNPAITMVAVGTMIGIGILIAGINLIATALAA